MYMWCSFVSGKSWVRTWSTGDRLMRQGDFSHLPPTCDILGLLSCVECMGLFDVGGILMDPGFESLCDHIKMQSF